MHRLRIAPPPPPRYGPSPTAGAARTWIAPWLVVAAWLLAPPGAVASDVDPVRDPSGLREEARSEGLDSLKTVPVPLPSTIGEYVKDQRAAIALGKALFWDQQAGSDGMACASCHFHAGADARVKNQISPGLIGGNGRFDRLPSGASSGGPGHTLSRDDFPLHRKDDPESGDVDGNVDFDTDDVVASAGVLHLRLLGLTKATAAGVGEEFDAPQTDPLGFSIHAHGKRLNTRRVEARNTPTVINAAFNHRNFWDGRANFSFNGRNPFGPRDPDARVWKYHGARLESIAVLLDNASLASQAVGPVENVVEMAASGRTFLHVGRKLLGSTPLAQQAVAATDSVLGPYARSAPAEIRTGLAVGYGDLIRAAFVDSWWSAPGHPIVVEGVNYSQMEANFSLFWGLAIMLYERTLVSDDSPFDRFMEGDNSALTAQQRVGLSLFLDEGKCVNCHAGPEFTTASTNYLGHDSTPSRFHLIERMPVPSSAALYDEGFYNIGVRPAFEDPGIAGRDPFGNPLSFAAQATGSRRTGDHGWPFADPGDFASGPGRPPVPGERLGVVGAFKTPTLRNVDLTGPYFHNGGTLTLEQVVQFYARGGDFATWNRHQGIATDPDIEELSELNGDRDNLRAVAAFMRSLTDPRVAHERAPFDHPSLSIPEGHLGVLDAALPGAARSEIVVKAAVGAAGLDTPIQPFLGGSLVGPDGVPRDDGLDD